MSATQIASGTIGGLRGRNGTDGTPGASAFDQAVMAGYQGTEQQYTALLAGTPGYAALATAGASAAQLSAAAVAMLAGVTASFTTHAAAVAATIADGTKFIIFADETNGGFPWVWQKPAGSAIAAIGPAAPESPSFYGQGVDIVVIGDSIANALSQAGNTTHIETYLQQAEQTLSRATTYNFAVAGSLLDSTLYGIAASNNDAVRQYSLHAAAHAPNTTGRRGILFIHTGENDFVNIVGTSTTAQAYLTALFALTAQARADGYQVIADTCVFRQDNPSSGLSAAILDVTYAVNDGVRRSKAIDAYCDVAQLLPDTTDTTYFRGDNIHPKDAGNAVIARGWRAAYLSLGVPTPAVPTALPQATWYDDPLRPADRSILMKAAIEGTSDNLSFHSEAPFSTALPAIGTGDYTVSAWVYVPAGLTRMSFLANAARSSEWGALGSGNYFDAYVLPDGAPQVRFQKSIAVGRWQLLRLVRASGQVSCYINGKSVGVPEAHAVDVGSPAIIPLYLSTRVARLRVFNAAKDAPSALAEFKSLSAYDPDDATCIYAMADAGESRGFHVRDLTGNGHDLSLYSTHGAAYSGKIVSPAQRGQLIGSASNGQVVRAVQDIGDKVTGFKFKTDGTAAGLINIGFTNGAGDVYQGTPGVNKVVDVPMAGLPAAARELYVNITGGGSITFVIDHAAA